MFDPNIQAKLVYDGGNVTVPQDLMPKGLATEAGWEKIRKAEQLRGSPKEQLCELAGRACYDSLGQGRNSEQYWAHIRQVGHFSVIEHAYYSVGLTDVDPKDFPGLLMALLNRRGVWVTTALIGEDRYGTWSDLSLRVPDLRITLNIRALLDWEKWTRKSSEMFKGYAISLGTNLYQLIQPQAPLILPVRPPQYDNLHGMSLELVDPAAPNETTVSMFLSGSRGWSHEQVRHRENISQRSTRYVDEDESPWIQHPLIAAFLADENASKSLNHWKVNDKVEMPYANMAVNTCRQAYSKTVDLLQEWLLSKGVDKLTARKQARGAARGYLGNALRTEMIFTTSVDGWKEIIRQRLNPAADAEIRHVYAMVLDELRKSRYVCEFDKFTTVPAGDGLGVVLKEIP